MPAFNNQRPNEVLDRMNKKENIQILDVREAMEWISGHIPSAKHIPLGELSFRHEELDKDQDLIVVCHSGNRSKLACEWLSELGYKVTNMSGGMSSWPGEVAFGQ